MNNVTTTESGAPVRVEYQVHFAETFRRRKELRLGEAPALQREPLGRIPRISRLMALAIRFERLIADGEIRDYAELANLGHVTRARVTQIMNLLCLAPNIQEDILFLPRIENGRDPIKEWMVRPIAAVPDWRKQRTMWRELQKSRAKTAAQPPCGG